MKLKSIIEQMEKQAKEYATQKHSKQKRKFSKEPYVEHPKRVAELIRTYKSSKNKDELISAALLHDTIEDTDTTEEDLKKLFGGLVASLVKELSSDDEGIKKLGKTEYLTDKMLKMSSWALTIKLADRLENVSDLKDTSDKFRDKYTKETKKILQRLEKERELSNTQKKLVSIIKQKLNEL